MLGPQCRNPITPLEQPRSDAELIRLTPGMKNAQFTIHKAALLTILIAWLGAGAVLPAAAMGDIQGQVVNGTTNAPAANLEIDLLMPRGGMAQVASVKTDAQGHFVIRGSSLDSNAFYLLQAVYQGVKYHSPLQPQQSQAAGQPAGPVAVKMTVYDSTRTAPALQIKSSRVIMRAEGGKVRVQELFAVENPSQPARSYVNDRATFRFHVGAYAGTPASAVVGELNMPIPQTPKPGAKAGDFSLDYPLKPGLTVVEVAYEADYAAGRFSLQDSIPYPIAQIEFDLIPPTLALQSTFLKDVGKEPETGAERYQAVNLQPGRVLQVSVSGEAAQAGSPDQGEETITIVPNSMTRLGWPLLACLLLVLLWALGVRMAKEWPSLKSQSPASPAQKRIEAKIESMLNSLADLDELFAEGKVPEKRYWKDRLELKARLIAVLKKSPTSLIDSYASRNIPR